MTGFTILLLSTALFGFLPLAIILYRTRKARQIVATGQIAKARVYHIISSRRPPQDTVYYTFADQRTAKQYRGQFSIAMTEYKVGDTLDIYHDADNPKHNTVKGAWGSPVLIGFGIVIAVFVLLIVYEQWQTANVRGD